MTARVLFPALVAGFFTAGLVAAGPVVAAPAPQPGFDPKLTGLVEARPNARACFRRDYDADHLAAHPKQTVSAIGLCVKVVHYQARNGGRYRYDFELKVRLRGRAKLLTATGECGFSEADPAIVRHGAGPITCALECDGGGIDVEPDKAGGGLVARLDRIRLSDGCGEEGVELTGGADDRVFRLQRVPAGKARR